MSTPSSLGRSILRWVAIFLLAQAALLAGAWAVYAVPWARIAVPLAASAAFHALLAGLLLWRRPDFRVEGSEEPLPRVNAPNVITLGRLSSIPTILALVLLAREYPVLPVALPFLCVVFASDFVDGIVARGRGGVTFVGRYLDSSSDYLLLVTVSILYLVEGLIPAWFFWLLMARLVLFAAGMAWATLRQGAIRPVTTFLGKAMVFAVMVLYAMETAERFGVPWVGDPRVVRVMEYLVAGVIVVSLADKAVFLRRLFGRN
jgi:CDP-diacylglycerol--glycerol-3-phosphate 3-phosphatidyltransferase